MKRKITTATGLVTANCLLAALYGCSFGDTKTLGDLKYKPEVEKKIEFEQLDHQPGA